MKEEAKVTIAIPTCSSERIPLLIQTVESIQAGSYKNVHPIIIADGNPYIYKVANKRLHNITVVMNKERVDWVASVNRVLREWESEYYIFASDDLIFPHDCIENAMATMQRRFPDGFGVVDLGKKNRGIFGLFGRKLVGHFPNNEVFCPDYVHYCSDGEFYRAMKKMKKYAYPPERESRVKHFRLNDDTRRLARRIRARDREIWHEREDKGYLWGIDFNLITRQ